MANKRIILAIVLVMVFCQVFAQPAEAGKSGDICQKHTGPWKWDVTIYDRPGWSTSWLLGIKLLPNDEFLLQCESYNEARYHEDFYAEDADVTTLHSKDGGLLWQEVPNERFPDQTIETLTDGTMVKVDTVYGLPVDLDKVRRLKLKEASLEHLADVDGYLIFPE